MTTQEITVVAHTPNGREIRFDGQSYTVQPRNDNYWITCASVAEAMYRYEFPLGNPDARRLAELIVATWNSQWSIDETARVGVASEDAESAAEMAGDETLAAAVIREIVAICAERATK